VTRPQRLTLIATILGSAIVFLDSTVVSVALPAISEDLDTGLAGQQWVVEAYLLALVSLLLVGGSLGDRFGRKRMFVFGLIGFGATSFLAAIAPSTGFLIGARALQGIAGALLVPGSLAILAATFEGAARGRAVGMWTAWSGIATVVGPAGGGALVDALDWRAIFWVNLPLILVTLYLTRAAMVESRDPAAARSVDFTGIVLSAVGLGGPVFALIEQPRYGWGDPLVFLPLVIGVVSFVSFLVWEARTREPLLDLTLFRIRNFAVANGATFSTYAGLYGGLFFLGLYLQQAVGYTPLEAGFATTPSSLMMFVLSPRFGRLASGTGPRLPMTVGPIVAGIGTLLMLRIGPDADYVTDVLPGILVFGLGLSATVAPLTATVLDSVEMRHAGVASGINNAVARVAGLLAIALLGALIAAQFSRTLDDQLAGDSLSPPAERAVEDARDAVLAPTDTGDLPPQERAQVEPAIAAAAEDGFHLGLIVGGVLMIAGGITAGIGIRNPERPGPVRAAPLAATAADCGHEAECGHYAPRRPVAEPVGATSSQ
jgi:EmrB/QacA subfamily drug resistance transporter